MPERIAPDDLIPMDMFHDEPVSIDLVYADANHPENIFGIAAYHKDARLILHKDLARIVLKAARILQARHGWTLVLKDGLRPVEAQAALMETDIVRRNPHWLEEPRMLSGPGKGAHPRGRAVDVSVRDRQGAPVDMGTMFDEMTPESARGYSGFAPKILQNRAYLEEGFVEAAAFCKVPLLPLPSEWWDFRIPSAHYGDIEPLYDRDLPPSLTICSAPKKDAVFAARCERLAKDIILSI